MQNLDDIIRSAEARASQSAKKAANKYQKGIQAGRFNDLPHLKNHLNYLFRTDAEQKWTNDQTIGNIYILQSEGTFQFLSAGTLPEREQFKNAIYTSIRRKARIEGKNLASVLDKLVMLRTDYLDPHVFSFNEQIKEYTEEYLLTLPKELKGYEFITAVVHADQPQNYLHLHVLAYADLKESA